MAETTLIIIKPNAMKKHVIGQIIQKFEENHLSVVAGKLLSLTKKQCEDFYREHEGRPFFDELTTFMSSHPVLVMALSGKNVVMRVREIMGATNPLEAKEGTIRKLFGDSLGENAIHGSDSQQSAIREVSFFFKEGEIFV